MNIGLCMTVKDERQTLPECLGSIHDLFDEILIIDTGSSDGTQDYLRTSFGLEVVERPLLDEQCLALSPLRNWGFSQLNTPWVMTLDADERISRSEMLAVCELANDIPADGLFCPWITHYEDGPSIEDYKLSLFRNGFRKQGLIHATVQADFRQQNARADWCEQFSLQHYPDASRLTLKDERYGRRLDCAHKQQPDWFRYHWFRGYMRYRQGELQAAESDLLCLHEARPPLFPVESLNASMVLASLYAGRQQRDRVEQVLQSALAYHDQVADDFEIRVNFRLRPWLQEGLAHLSSSTLQMIKPYAFPY